MKNFFGFCEDRNETDGAPFIIRSVGEKLQKDKDGNAAALEKIRRKSTLPVWLSVVKWILLFFFVIVLISTLRAGPRGGNRGEDRGEDGLSARRFRKFRRGA